MLIMRMYCAGMLIMLMTCALIGWMVALHHALWGVIVGVCLFVTWFWPTHYQFTTGLFKANLNSYFTFRHSGQSVEEAMLSMVEARYRSNDERRLRVSERIARVDEGMRGTVDEEGRVVLAVETIFLDTHNIQLNPLDDKYRNQIRSLYRKVR